MLIAWPKWGRRKECCNSSDPKMEVKIGPTAIADSALQVIWRCMISERASVEGQASHGRLQCNVK